MSASPKTILVVDDSAMVRKFLSWVLKPQGLQVLEAETGTAALKVLAASPVDAAIVDINMPEMDGIELVKRIRGDSAKKDLPVIMLTTETTEADRRAALAAGANVFLPKPSTPDVIRSKVLSVLGMAPEKS